MSLVGYAYSDDEDEEQTDDRSLSKNLSPQSTTTTANEPKPTTKTNGSQLSADTLSDIPKTTSTLSSDSSKPLANTFPSFLATLSKDVIKKTPSGRIQIAAPSLSLLTQADDDDQDSDEETRRKRFKKSDHGSRLISMLPKPQKQSLKPIQTITNKPTSSLTSLVPNSVANRKQIPSKSDDNSTKNEKAKNQNSVSSSSFFFTNDTNSDEDDSDEDVEKRIPFAEQLMSAPMVSTSSTDEPSVDAPVYGPSKPMTVSHSLPPGDLYTPDESPIDPNEDMTYKKFIASKFGEDPAENIKFVDFDMSKHLSQNQDWLKNITVEKSVKDEDISGPVPNSTARRKNQITFLAYQAKKREVDLKNEWAKNKLSKSQTRAKYGF